MTVLTLHVNCVLISIFVLFYKCVHNTVLMLLLLLKSIQFNHIIINPSRSHRSQLMSSLYRAFGTTVLEDDSDEFAYSPEDATAPDDSEFCPDTF